jgi:CheY-like chemotaxis protein
MKAPTRAGRIAIPPSFPRTTEATSNGQCHAAPTTHLRIEPVPPASGTALIPARAFRCHHLFVTPTVLVVDDSASFRWFARELLDAEGFLVIGEAETGSAAVEAVDRLDPDVVLLDIALPDIDGFEVCARITRAGGARPAVVLTSSRDAEDFHGRLDACAARGFLPKASLTGAALAALAYPG